MRYTYKTTGTCSKEISFNIDNNIVTDIKFIGGCPGNLKMISKILDGWKIEDIINMCKGNLCGMRNTSCADQLSKALEEVQNKEKSYS